MVSRGTRTQTDTVSDFILKRELCSGLRSLWGIKLFIFTVHSQMNSPVYMNRGFRIIQRKTSLKPKTYRHASVSHQNSNTWEKTLCFNLPNVTLEILVFVCLGKIQESCGTFCFCDGHQSGSVGLESNGSLLSSVTYGHTEHVLIWWKCTENKGNRWDLPTLSVRKIGLYQIRNTLSLRFTKILTLKAGVSLCHRVTEYALMFYHGAPQQIYLQGKHGWFWFLLPRGQSHRIPNC